jgi:hypothetical protein
VEKPERLIRDISIALPGEQEITPDTPVSMNVHHPRYTHSIFSLANLQSMCRPLHETRPVAGVLSNDHSIVRVGVKRMQSGANVQEVAVTT